jgi:hypothetical protein
MEGVVLLFAMAEDLCAIPADYRFESAVLGSGKEGYSFLPTVIS